MKTKTEKEIAIMSEKYNEILSNIRKLHGKKEAYDEIIENYNNPVPSIRTDD
jgi:hypothetical protein